MKKYYLIRSKENDYNACNTALFSGDVKFIRGKVYFYKEIPEEDYKVLYKYFDDISEWDWVDEDYLEEYF